MKVLASLEASLTPMKFTQSPLQNAWILEIEPRGDERGYFARTFCRNELEAHGLDATIVQSNSSYSRDAGTLRGMHYQKAPAEETKMGSLEESRCCFLSGSCAVPSMNACTCSSVR